MKLARAFGVITSLLLPAAWLGAADSNDWFQAFSSATDPSATNSARDALTAQDAERAINRMRTAIPGGIGTWYRIHMEPRPDQATASTTNAPGQPNAGAKAILGEWTAVTNAIYVRNLPDGRRFMRKEVAEVDHLGRSTIKLYVHDDEGYWALHKHVAILYPESTAIGSAVMPEAPEKRPAEESGSLTVPFSGYSGKRIQVGGRPRLCIVAWYGTNTFRELAKKMKQEVPLIFRPLVRTLSIELFLEQSQPFRVETLVDEETGDRVSQWSYTRDGRLLFENHGWSATNDLPVEAYMVPPSVEKLRPKSLREAQKLDKKATVEDTKPGKP